MQASTSCLLVPMRSASLGQRGRNCLETSRQGAPPPVNAASPITSLTPPRPRIQPHVFPCTDLVVNVYAPWHDPIRRRNVGMADRRVIQTAPAPTSPTPDGTGNTGHRDRFLLAWPIHPLLQGNRE
ncbi:hypothetical protein [Paracoccus sp. SSJ]|uniref:hypothetical protein n=1 Tax=Paracoccus sp. SSJ TaxID=3050636 RepID=UPI00254A3E67|nr:hypothetical protein [Paracoccus sp. SSJ]MDK8873730.1 hypothetical protein [Paracoccus sp. SSJ]